MPGNKLKYGLNIKNKTPESRTRLIKKRVIFDEDEDEKINAEITSTQSVEEEINEVGGVIQSSVFPSNHSARSISQIKRDKATVGVCSKKTPILLHDDLSSSLLSKKYEKAAKDIDANIYDYDGVYDSIKQTLAKSQDDKDRKPRYMANLIAAAAVRKRDTMIAEEKRLARERDAEGDEFAGKEKFVTSAYKKQQEENRRIEMEEKAREDLDAKKHIGTGMLNFYKNILQKDEIKHARILKAVDEREKNEPYQNQEPQIEKTASEIAREINEKNAGTIIVNDDGDVVDKRQLLTGGLNIISKQNRVSKTNLNTETPYLSQKKSSGNVGTGGAKQAMRERQSIMIQTQLEQASKRALEQEEEKKQQIERASKSRKTHNEITLVKERYLARKREAAEARK